jgi:hypothetical protein
MKSSHSTFHSKLRQLLYSDGVQHEEQITEVLVGGFLAHFNVPINMEPISTIVATPESVPRTVDYSILWSPENSTIFVESTVFHIRKLIDWEGAVADLKNSFEREMANRSLNRGLRITAPLSLSRQTLSPKVLRGLVRRISKDPTGHASARLGDDTLLLEWSPVPQAESIPESFEEQGSPFGFIFGSGFELACVAATTVSLKWPGDAENLVIRSLRNSLDAKRQQFELAVPYFLIIRLLSNHISVESVTSLIERRVFSNNQYQRISALGVMQVVFDSEAGFQCKTKIALNPLAVHPLPDTFVRTVARTIPRSER